MKELYKIKIRCLNKTQIKKLLNLLYKEENTLTLYQQNYISAKLFKTKKLSIIKVSPRFVT
jgi:hypothetical protein